MKPSEILSLLEQSGALLRGHFRLSSGLHSGQYFQCARLLSDTAVAERLGRAIAEAVQGRFGRPETVVAPALGGVIIGHETARALGARSIFTERENGAMTLRRGFSVRPGERTVVVEDVFTTGKSTGEVV